MAYKDHGVEWLNKIHTGQAFNRSTRDGMESMARRLSGVGLDLLARQCLEHAANLEEADKIISDGLNLMLTQEIQKGDERSAAMLTACLAGVVIADPKNRDLARSLSAAVNKQEKNLE